MVDSKEFILNKIETFLRRMETQFQTGQKAFRQDET